MGFLSLYRECIDVGREVKQGLRIVHKSDVT